jgi:hypothetical protein
VRVDGARRQAKSASPMQRIDRTSPPRPEDRLRFLQDIQRLIDEGLYSATYKFALLSALTDLAVAKGDVGGEALDIQVSEIAERFIECYWRQSSPFPAVDGEPVVLLQNKVGQAAVVTAIQLALDDVGGSVARVRSQIEPTLRPDFDRKPRSDFTVPVSVNRGRSCYSSTDSHFCHCLEYSGTGLFAEADHPGRTCTVRHEAG